MRQQLEWFANQMESKLQENDHKGGWEDCGVSWLYGRLMKEIEELGSVASDDFENLIAEATDVANFAMMIADKARIAFETTAILSEAVADE